jgi:hypothetical protein
VKGYQPRAAHLTAAASRNWEFGGAIITVHIPMAWEGKHRSAGELAEAEGVTRSSINRMLRLTLLAPDIQEAVFEGRQRGG